MVGPGPDSLIVNSPRAGGEYIVTRSAERSVRRLDNDMKARLTWWLVEQRRQGETCPKITSYTLDAIRSLPMPSIIERRDRVLDFVAARSPTIATRIQLAGVVTDELRALKHALAAHTGSQSDAEVSDLIRFAKEAQLLEGPEILHLTFKGWTYIEERRARQIASVQGFVAMWISAEMEQAYERGFARAIRDSGYEPRRIDRKEHINKIDDEIIAEIRRSRFLVADFTSEAEKPRGGVYFEAGFAFGLNIPVIWSCREDLVKHLHFDTRQFNHIVWTEAEDLYQKLKNRIGAVLGDGPLVAR
jgi:nucleoside 2-deoxyribosyltransferase